MKFNIFNIHTKRCFRDINVRVCS